MRLGLLGGTFDPVHLGHLIAASEAYHAFDLSSVVFIPSARPPHKTDEKHSPVEHRLRMVELATGGDERFSVSRIELERSGLSYTIDTVKQVKADYGPEVEVFFIVGTDSILEIDTWFRPEELLYECRFIVASRPGYSLENLLNVIPRRNSVGEPAENSVTLMEIPAVDISSTDIRKRVSEGRPIKYLVPDEVRDYIVENGLYSKGQETPAS